MDTIDSLRAQARDEARLREDWRAQARSKPFYPYPYICDDGLMLGAATQIAAMGEDRTGGHVLNRRRRRPHSSALVARLRQAHCAELGACYSNTMLG